jgi:hypothetical protein
VNAPKKYYKVIPSLHQKHGILIFLHLSSCSLSLNKGEFPTELQAFFPGKQDNPEIR